MLNNLDAWYLGKEEPVRSCLLALRTVILEYDRNISETWTHRMPMFRLNGKLFCYLWTDKKTEAPYLGIYKGIEIEHPDLILGKRNKMKVIYFDANKSLPIKKIREIFALAVPLYGAAESK